MKLFNRKPKETLTFREVSPVTTLVEIVTASGGYRAHTLPFTIERIEQILLDAEQGTEVQA